MGKDERESSGGEWVKGYRKKDGTEAHGFCRGNVKRSRKIFKYLQPF